MKTVTFRQLRVFTEVAKHLSFVRAAEHLHLTPPAVTMQVKELESAIDLPLFDREGRKVSLTTAGEYFLVYAKRMLSTLKDANDAMARFRKLESGLLSIGMVSTACPLTDDTGMWMIACTGTISIAEATPGTSASGAASP